ncbi:serine hydrolase [Novosphingobium sp. FKTRR1]|uniref:serine hydrolase domain-containing protein n=1 Tax=Novosphingobium sp. FKTRR1 TaxID=2879118 RepID=UPI001CF0C55A|nr:serine hydrolase domain-containing protein [Novosphingobium sp. FKTRR1]
MKKYLAAALMATLAVFGATAQTSANPAPSAAPIAPAGRALTADDVNAWLDGYMPAALARGEVAGAVVVVVKDGQILTERGFGVSDVATGAPVDPKRTAFRPGSVSKLFAWTAVMQLVEQGKLNLDADVNTYLDYRIPPRGGKPITLRNLMTHTPGFEEIFKGMEDPKLRNPSLGAFMRHRSPARVFDAGTTPAYSNYGASLAGYIVERVSHEPFDVYVQNHIFKPLDMQNSSFSLPMQKRILDLMSKGYPDATKPAKPFENIVATPAGNMAGTGDDMAHFMIAHLQDGKFGNTQILKPETAQQMHNSLTQLMPPLHGFELGFMVNDINGHKVIGHGGDTALFHSGLWLFMGENVGLFVSVNSSGVNHGFSRGQLFEAFADRYFPGVQNDGKVDAKTAAEHAKLVSGNYYGVRGFFTNFLSLAGLMGQVTVTTDPDGTVIFPVIPRASGEPIHYREIAPFVWRAVGGHERFGAVVKDGKVVRVSSDSLAGFMVFNRVAWWQDASWILPFSGAGALIVILTALGWPVIALVRRRHGAKFPLIGKRAKAYRLVRIGAVVALMAIGAVAALFASISADGGLQALTENDWPILVVSGLVLLGFGGGLLAAFYNLYAVLSEKSGWFAKLWGGLLALSFVALLWFAQLGGLLTFSTDF